MKLTFSIILCIHWLSFGDQFLCNAQNNRERELELFKAVEEGEPMCIKLIKQCCLN